MSLHIVRRTAEGQEVPITLDEWNAYIDSDADLKRPEPGHPNYGYDALALLPAEGVNQDDWQWLWWVTGSIFSDYPQRPMLKKMGQIARDFNAVLSGDEGDVWTIDENGIVTIGGQ
jgi:hypothetical protein